MAIDDVLHIIYEKLKDSVNINQFQVSLVMNETLTNALYITDDSPGVLNASVDSALSPLRNWVSKHETSLYMFDTARCLDDYFTTHQEKEHFLAVRSAHPEELSGTLFVVPLKVEVGVIGVFTIHLRQTSGLDSYQCSIVESIASYSAIAIANALSHEQLENKNCELAVAYERLQSTQRELFEAEKIASLGRLVAGVSHEINTPLGNAITSESALRKQLGEIREKFDQKTLTQTQFSQFLEICHQTLRHVDSSLSRVTKLISSFRQMSLAQNEEMRQRIDLVQLLKQDEATLRMDPRSEHIHIEFSLPESLYINSFPGVIHEIIEHLYENTVTHAFEDQQSPRMQIVCEQLSEDLVCICFSDNGIGIDSDVQDKVFEPFYSTSMARTTGLGLNIVYNLVNKVLGGKISLTSALKQGTSFRITLPLDEANNEA